MSAAPPTYDLVLMLDPQAEDAARAKLVADARAAIESQGELVRHDEWGNRALAYPIGHRAVAEYHLMQFHASSAGLLSALDRSLRIADEALRFRIVKLRPGTGEAPDMRSSAEPPSPTRAAPARQPAPAAAGEGAQEPQAGAGSESEGAQEPRAGAGGEGEGESRPGAEASGESAEGAQEPQADAGSESEGAQEPRAGAEASGESAEGASSEQPAGEQEAQEGS